MSFQAISAKLVLRSFDLPADAAATNVGYASNNKATCTWTNINLRDLMGDRMFEDFDQFNIVLTNVISGVSATLGTTADDRSNLIYMSGLAWMGQGYNTATKRIETKALVGSANYEVGTGIQWASSAAANVCTFQKTANLNGVTISLIRAVDGTVPASEADFNLTYVFSIYGVKTTARRKRLLL
jgi:hypothetical protein